MARRKTVAKTANQSAIPELRVRPDGRGALLSGGMPGNKGGGRPPEAFKAFLARLRADPDFHKALENAALDSTSKGFQSAIKVITDYDDDKPAEKRQIVGPIEVKVSFAREGKRTTSS